MTQQQIAYMNARTSRTQLEYSKKQAEAAEKQAKAAERSSYAAESQAESTKKRTDWDTGWGYWLNWGSGALATIGGIIALALI